MQLASRAIGTLAWLATTAAIAAPDLTGIWKIEAPITELKTSQGSAPPLNVSARDLYADRMQKHLVGDESFDPTKRCVPPGEPRIMYDLFPFEITQTPTQVFFTYEWNKLFRIVDIDVKKSVIAPTYFGTSVGHWDKETLVIDVQGLRADTLLDASGLPHSDALHLTERYQLRNRGTKILVTLQFDDPQTFRKPWQARLILDKQPTDRLGEDICEERLGYVK